MGNNVFQLIARLFINGYWFGCLDDACDKLEHVYSMVFVDNFVAVKDPYRFRLLVMEVMSKGVVVFVFESCVLNLIKAKYEREMHILLMNQITVPKIS